MSNTSIANPAQMQLFLSPDSEGGQTLTQGLPASALLETGPGLDHDHRPQSFLDTGGDPDSLRDQGWAIIAPQGIAGDRLLSQVAPLLARRASDQQRDAVDIYRVPPGMTAPAAVQWVEHELIGNRPLADIPGYVCVLGGPELVSFELQQVLTGSFCTGRIAFDHEAHYQAYVDKLLRWEATPSRGQSRALFFTARDGTAATELGHDVLMTETASDVRARAQRARPDDVQVFAGEDPRREADAVLAAASAVRPSLLMTCSHGLGAPRRGWGDAHDRQRALQGALCLGRGEIIAADSLSRGPFLPGGLWFFFACFSAGTPARSAYHHWLRRLHELGEFGGELESVLSSLPGPGVPPFVAALPRAVLANPDGPLAVVGHLDLAWTYSFLEITPTPDRRRHRRFTGLLDLLLRGKRVGLALADLQRARHLAETDIAVSADEAERVQAASGPSLEQRIRLGHRWMLRQDLDGYVVLGDPAARLAIEPPGMRV